MDVVKSVGQPNYTEFNRHRVQSNAEPNLYLTYGLQVFSN